MAISPHARLRRWRATRADAEENFTVFRPGPQHEKSVNAMLDQLLAWSGALAMLRANRWPWPALGAGDACTRVVKCLQSSCSHGRQLPYAACDRCHVRPRGDGNEISSLGLHAISCGACDRALPVSGPRGRRFKSCLPDSEGRDSARETDGTRPSPFPDGALRTTGAPKSVTPGAEGAASAVPPITAAAALLVETCATLAVQAARRGDLAAAKYLPLLYEERSRGGEGGIHMRRAIRTASACDRSRSASSGHAIGAMGVS